MNCGQMYECRHYVIQHIKGALHVLSMSECRGKKDF